MNFVAVECLSSSGNVLPFYKPINIMTMRLLLRLWLFWRVSEALFQLRLGPDTTFFWNLDYSKNEFVAEIHSKNVDPNGGWVGIGFSDFGNISDGSGDYCIVWKSLLSAQDQNTKLQITDVYIENGTSIISPDIQQDCKDFRYLIQNDTLKWTFRRKFITCDLDDYAIEEGTTHLHWVKGSGPLFNIKGVSIKKASDLGFIRVRFLKNLKPNPILNPSTTWTFDVINAKVKVPAVETMYWCHIVKLPEALRKKHHVIQFAVNVQKGNEELVHHMEVFHCEASATTDFPLYSGPCDATPKEISVCSRVMAAWAMGAEALHYPEITGFPIGGPDFNPYVRLEIHYNNPKIKNDWVDSSGMTFWVTSKLRQFDAGVIELGLEYTDKDSIPPRQNGFLITGVCNRECTSVGIPPTGIKVFASQLHTHLTGIRVVTRHYRKRNTNESETSESMDGYYELPTFNWDNHYSTHFQEIRLLKNQITVLPGDILLTSCEYKTTDRSQMTLGGFAISDEMCVNYIHYYPRTNLEVCKSSVSWTSLREYFDFLEKMEGQKVDPGGGVSTNYKNIEWTPFRAQLLFDFYNKSPIDMQCNQSDGNRFPGLWDSMKKPQFTPIPPRPQPNLDCILQSNSKPESQSQSGEHFE